MPASTRKSNRDANFKAYYSKKPLKQRHFPERTKTVREKPGARQDVPEPRQMTFLPEKMRIGAFVADSEGEDEVEEEELSTVEPTEEEGVDAVPETVPVKAASGGRRMRKRNSDVLQEARDEGQEEEEPTPPASKRRKPIATTKSRRRSAAVTDQPASSTETEPPKVPKLRRRQSTMTQLVDGRRPGPEDEEPEFTPIRRSSTRRRSKGKDIKQRTLTQMVHGLAPVGNVTDEEVEEEVEVEEDPAYANALAEHLTQSGIFEPSAEASAQQAAIHDDGVQMNEIDAADEHDEDSYHPSQHIRTTGLERRRTSRRISGRQSPKPAAKVAVQSTPKKRSRFSLLATPERRITFLPSSQSPPDSPLSTQRPNSTQNTPSALRLPLIPRSENVEIPQDTPSKRKKVAFQDVVEEVGPPAPSFGTVVPDSEDDEDDDDLEGDFDIGAETQNLLYGINIEDAVGRNIGAETQAMLGQIDQACANVEEDMEQSLSESSEQLGVQTDAGNFEESQELGIQRTAARLEEHASSPVPPGAEYPSSPPVAKQEDLEEEDGMMLPPLQKPVSQREQHIPSDLRYVDQGRRDKTPVRSGPDRGKARDRGPPASQARIKNEPDTEENDPPSTPPQQPLTTQDTSPYDETDLDGAPIIQVARSPTKDRWNTQDTTGSHSSRVEHQIQSEWLSYSQYPAAPGTATSSMYVAPDSSSLYQASHPFSLEPSAQPPPPLWTQAALSQATTVVDSTQRSPSVTPRKSQHSRLASANTTPRRIPNSRNASANTTPRRIPNSQPNLMSPQTQMPNTLVIPSSFPSPSKVSYRDWSSPVRLRSEMGDGGMGSIEDFSIPPLPPGEEGEDDELF